MMPYASLPACLAMTLTMSSALLSTLKPNSATRPDTSSGKMCIRDSRGIAQAVAEQAKLWDLETCCVEDFRDVMGAFAAFDPHLVLLDISLPAFDGYHWCSRIRQVSKVPVIFISSAADSMNIVMAMNLGADDFIAKPFDQNVLMAKVLALLRRTYDFGQAVPCLLYTSTASFWPSRWCRLSLRCSSGSATRR